MTRIARVLLLAGVSLLAACAKSVPPAELVAAAPHGAPFCDVARKIRISIYDTAETIDQARVHNTKWDCLCLPKKPAYCAGRRDEGETGANS